jgi:outer membrane protein
VGTITELLSAQTALADARRQRVLALSRWRTAKLKLASSLGILELADAAHQ